jgi:hypothetical protein
MTNTKILRGPDRAEGGITAAEREAMARHVELWTERALRTNPIESDKIIPAIQGLYAAARLRHPRVVIVPSPKVMAFAGGFAAAIWYLRKNQIKTREATLLATREATDVATAMATLLATREATDVATRVATDVATDAATREATDAATDVATRVATREATDMVRLSAELSGGFLQARFFLECAVNWWRFYQGGNMWAAWDCYLTAARDILGLRLPIHEKYAAWEQAAIHGGFRLIHEEFCMVSDFPEVIKVDAENRPHCTDGPSHRWRDGWSLYHVHGISVPAEWIEDKASLTPQVALTWNNIEQRRIACELVGWERILSEMDACTIDKDEDPMIGELVEVDIPDVGRERFLRVLCGTQRRFALPVPPNMRTALEANAWTFGLDEKSFIKPEIRT